MKTIVVEEIIMKEVNVPDGATYQDVRELYFSGTMIASNKQVAEVNVRMNEDESFIKLV